MFSYSGSMCASTALQFRYDNPKLGFSKACLQRPTSTFTRSFKTQATILDYPYQVVWWRSRSIYIRPWWRRQQLRRRLQAIKVKGEGPSNEEAYKKQIDHQTTGKQVCSNYLFLKFSFFKIDYDNLSFVCFHYLSCIPHVSSQSPAPARLLSPEIHLPPISMMRIRKSGLGIAKPSLNKRTTTTSTSSLARHSTSQWI